MMIHRICGLSVLLAALTLPVGCSSLKAKNDSAAATEGTTAPQEPAGGDVTTGGANTGAGLTSEQVATPVAPPAPKTAAEKLAQAGLTAAGLNLVRFPYDSDTLADADMNLLRKHAEFLKANADVQVRLEGHTDERGTQEYNMALGERRGKAVAVFLQSQGVKAGQLEVVSFGELKPLADGEDEASWAQNRRVELVYH
jgi:peptidoglycan-associated lipoprotein